MVVCTKCWADCGPDGNCVKCGGGGTSANARAAPGVVMSNTAFKNAFGQNIDSEHHNVNIEVKSSFVGSCIVCSSPLGTSSIITSPMGKAHRDCWKCTKCNTMIGTGPFVVGKDNKPYCDSCGGAPSGPSGGGGGCHGCGQALSGNVVSFSGVDFHQNCFKCCKCNGLITGQAYRSGGEMDYQVGKQASIKGGNPVCTNCKGTWGFK
eukprot:TRINITY_DN6269_c1_g1_i1.p1 TRINITY_DN6269_c1_g1~~TRINITY_DN6269_c1_g1_i1.p1  ORF type:complete len:207 (+),score=34.94 TRINITY_DN6269_c1_g1_i1:108-728(+)